METYGGSILYDSLDLEPSWVVWIFDASQDVFDRSAALIKGIRPGVKQEAVPGAMAGYTLGGELLRMLPRCIRIVTVRAGEPATVRIRGAGQHP